MVGWGLVALFGIGGFFFWRNAPELWIGQIWVGVAALLALIYILMTVRANKASTLVASGIRGSAQVLEMTQTGTYINEQPRVKLQLRIQAPGVTPFESNDTYTVPLIALGSLQPGRPLMVMLDPQNPQNFAIDWFGAGAGSRGAGAGADCSPSTAGSTEAVRTADLGGDPDPSVRLTKLTELRKAGTISDAEFEEHKRRILSDI